jgi:hypothetical protein
LEGGSEVVATILQASKSDTQLAAFLDEAREYAQVYLLAKDRKKGCEGTGELMTLKEEFRDIVDKMIRYCKAKDQLPRDSYDYDVDTIATLLMKKKD